MKIRKRRKAPCAWISYGRTPIADLYKGACPYAQERMDWTSHEYSPSILMNISGLGFGLTRPKLPFYMFTEFLPPRQHLA